MSTELSKQQYEAHLEIDKLNWFISNCENDDKLVWRYRKQVQNLTVKIIELWNEILINNSKRWQSTKN